MSEIVFLNNEPDQEILGTSNEPEKPDRSKEEAPFSKTEEIRSKDYTDIKPFYASRYGNSRLFTARYNGNKVILKTLKADRANNPQFKASLHNEYDVTSLLDNKYIRKALDFVNIQGLGDCIVFEFIEGKTLAEHVRVGTLSEKQVKSILVEICEGLSYMHRNQVVHSNLKPENIMVTANDLRVKLIDIGVPETDPDADRELLIKEMEFVAPELIKGEDSDARADIYSLGKIMEFIGERNISKQFNSVATHCTQFSREQRYDNISQVKMAVSNGHSILKIIFFLLLVGVVGGLAFVYIPKIKANVEKERAERMAVDFAREMENMRNELPGLCQKYQLKSISEPIAVNWTEDSLRLASTLIPFFGSDEYKSKAIKALNAQKTSIENSRQKDFDRLLLIDFKNANDSLAVQMKSNLPELSDSLLFIEAVKWFNLSR